MENTTISGPGPHACGHGQFDAQLVPCTAPSSLDSLEATKQLLSTLPPPPPYSTNSQRWRDAEPMGAYSATRPACQHSQLENDRPQPCVPFPRPPSPDMDDVPLGHLIPTQAFWEQDDNDDTASCADEAPPSYAVAVGQSDRDTLMHYFFRGPGGYGEADEESGVGLDMALEMQGLEDERYAVVRIVAMFTVAFILFAVSGVLVWMVLDGMLQ